MLLILYVAYVGRRNILEKSCGSYSKGTLVYCKDYGLFAHMGFKRDNSECQSVNTIRYKLDDIDTS